ncbi:GNAT family N-acetyltransferase [Pengzhenrongella frigida]|uniref:GNAT family N-acetyltransferase n=1 Tax=Pengzhenrongella frigida TaxID=1259133 RepID=A0A4V1ZGZ4_9MICO|nr:GNAT family N-acetyltransferase [Cellulomonas sp. HLT2-17]RYV50254.1 GNAT family N-acetyltransferase [Cellulomonas sp. HLT2-17]
MSETLGEVTIRPAEVADAPEISRVHTASWQEAYAGIVPAEYLDSLDPKNREPMWTEHLRNGPRDGVLTWIALSGDHALGFASLGPCRDEDAARNEQEIYSMYLDPGMWGKGVARDLLRTVLGEVKPPVPVSLWVLADSERGRHFYRRHGFFPDGTERLRDVGGQDLLELRYRRR